MKYSNKHILLALNETMFTKSDMKEQYKFSELPLLKTISDIIYKSELEYNKDVNRYMLIPGNQVKLPDYLPHIIQEEIHNTNFTKYIAKYKIHE